MIFISLIISLFLIDVVINGQQFNFDSLELRNFRILSKYNYSENNLSLPERFSIDFLSTTHIFEIKSKSSLYETVPKIYFIDKNDELDESKDLYEFYSSNNSNTLAILCKSNKTSKQRKSFELVYKLK